MTIGNYTFRSLIDNDYTPILTRMTKKYIAPRFRYIKNLHDKLEPNTKLIVFELNIKY
jgi:hypothetical protein